MKDLRNQLKEILKTELEALPASLESLEPKERVESLIKLMPFIFPKVSNSSVSQLEPTDWSSPWN